jgi:cell division protein FtsZ
MGIGHGDGENRAEIAAKAAIKSPLMSVSMKGAKGILFNVSGGSDLTIFEMQKAANIIKDTADEDAIVIWGHAINEDLNGSMRITVIATGFSEKVTATPHEPNPLTTHTSSAETSRNLLRGRTQLRPQPQPQLSIEEADLQPSAPEDDIFTVPGVPRTQYDIPAVLRRNQLKGRRQ